jgi:hypothetical protein
VQRDTPLPSASLAFFTFMMLLAAVTNWEPHGVTLAGFCYSMRHGMKVQKVTALRYGVTLQVCKKVNQCRYRPEQAQRVGKVIALIFRDLGARRR